MRHIPTLIQTVVLIAAFFYAAGNLNARVESIEKRMETIEKKIETRKN
jgi:hypothetical protein